MKQLILIRHGQSEWNLSNRFTGWTDVELSAHGREEARSAGRELLKQGALPDYCFTSYLRRAIHTLQIVNAETGRDWLPVVKDWHLNERHYGALQGLNKADTAAKYGDEQVHTWRRSYDVAPPALSAADPRYPGRDARYAALTADELPLTESLRDTVARVRCAWEERIIPALRLYDSVMVVAHGNSLRALAMLLYHITPQRIVSLEIPTAKPWIIPLTADLKPAESLQI